MKSEKKQDCFICAGQLWYMDANGDWILCPRCDLLRLSKAVQEVKTR